MLAVNRVGPEANQLAGEGGLVQPGVELLLWATDDLAEQPNQQVPQGGHCEARCCCSALHVFCYISS